MRFSSESYLRKAAFILSVLYILSYILLVLKRLNYPFELEWIEGAVVDHCRWILSGRGLYVPPSINFVPFNYPPLYFYVSALAMKIFGVGFFAPRFVSFISSLGCMGIIYFWVRYETKDRFLSFVTVGLFAAAYKYTGAWYDIARADSLQMFFIIAALYSARRLSISKGAVISAVLLVTSFYIKQSALLIALSLGIYYFFRSRKAFLIFSGIFLSFAIGAFLILYWKSNGWFYYYAVLIPQQHELVRSKIILFWADPLMRGIAPMFILVIAYLMLGKRKKIIKDGFAFFLLITVGCILIAFLTMIHTVAYLNNLIPVVAVIIVFSMISLRFLFGLAVRKGGNWNSFLWLILILQFINFVYIPTQQLPSAEDRSAGEKFINLLKGFDGDVLVRDHGYYSVLAGKRSFAQRMAVKDVMKNPELEFKGIKPAKILEEDIVKAISERKFSAVIMDSHNGVPYDEDLVEAYYKFSGKVFHSPESFYPITGYRTRPNFLYDKSK